MRYDGTVRLSATDLSAHAACGHLTELRLRQHLDGGEREPHFEGPGTKSLRERGIRHEREYLDHLASSGRMIVNLGLDDDPRPWSERIIDAARRTRDAIAGRADVIAQAAFQSDTWGGSADVLLWDADADRYRIVDTKLSRETKGGTILQLLVYAELLDQITGGHTEWVGVVAPGRDFRPEWHRVREYDAYYRLAKARLMDAIAARPNTYPDPVEHCGVCNWWQRCDAQRRGDDHLSLIAGISRGQRREAAEHDLATLQAFAEHDQDLWRPQRGSLASLKRTHRQARIQMAGRIEGKPLHQMLERDPDAKPPDGLAMLPEPDPGDWFFDIEGDRFAGESGLEYLFGTVDVAGAFTGRWAMNPREERAMVERFIDDLVARIEAHPGAHVYHYGHYEVSALKRLAQRYGTREYELDGLLRGRRFVDLHRVVRTSLVASVEGYSIKQLEPHYGYERAEDLERSRGYRRELEIHLEQGTTDALPKEMLASINDYNREDCESTLRLREWLETLRRQSIEDGEDIPRPVVTDPEPEKPRDPDLQALIDRLMDGVSDDPAERDDEQQTRATMAALTEYYQRERRNAWWEFIAAFDREDELDHLEAANTLAGLTFVDATPPEGKKKNWLLRFSFPEQRFDVLGSQAFWAMDFEDGVLGTIAETDKEAGVVTVSVTPERRDLRPSWVVIAPANLDKHKIAALGDVANAVAGNSEEFPAATDLLRRRPPTFAGRAPGTTLRTDQTLLQDACDLAAGLQRGVLAIQGPPGTGKTHTGAHLVARLVAEGKRVGVCALSHAAIAGLVRKINEEFHSVRTAHVGRDDLRLESGVAGLADGSIQVLGGTSFAWCKLDARGAIDVLVIEEAGQLTLADSIAAATAAPRLIMLGDPQQLSAPQQGAHPEGSGAAALQHFIRDHETIPPDVGLFIEHTRRLSAPIAGYTSDVFYEGRLEPLDKEIAGQVIEGESPLAGAGLYLACVEHDGNQSSSPEEVERVAELVKHLTGSGLRWRRGAKTESLGLDQVLIVAPYNAHVAALRTALPDGARIGSVDKFQGQEAPVVIVSLATSTPEDAPRGMEFLYSRNRLNVATSRARCAVILVCSPAILEPECRTPRHMRLANGYAAFVERATRL